MIAVVLATMALGQLGVEPTIDLESPAVRVVDVVDALVEASGRPLSVEGSIAEEPLIVRWDDAPVAAAMGRLAKVCDAAWVRTAEGWTLRVSPELQAARTDRAISMRRERLREVWPDEPGAVDEAWAAGLRRDLGRLDVDDSPDEVERVRERLPLRRLLARAIRAAGVDALARTPLGGRRAFGAPATRLQVELRDGLLEEFLAEVALLDLQELDRLGIAEPYVADLSSVTRVTLVAQHAAVLRLAIQLEDDAGRILFSESQDVLIARFQTDLGRHFERVPGTLELSDDMRRLAEFWLASQRPGPTLPVLDADLLERWLDPVTYDPIGPLAGETLLQVARADGRQFVARLPDGAFAYWPLAWLERTPSLSEAAIVLTGIVGGQVDSTGGWLTISPELTEASRFTRIDRRSLRALLQARDRITTDDLVDHLPERSESWQIALDVVAPLTPQGMGGWSGPPLGEALAMVRFLRSDSTPSAGQGYAYALLLERPRGDTEPTTRFADISGSGQSSDRRTERQLYRAFEGLTEGARIVRAVESANDPNGLYQWGEVELLEVRFFAAGDPLDREMVDVLRIERFDYDGPWLPASQIREMAAATSPRNVGGFTSIRPAVEAASVSSSQAPPVTSYQRSR